MKVTLFDKFASEIEKSYKEVNQSEIFVIITSARVSLFEDNKSL